jgi:hypothetical protein
VVVTVLSIAGAQKPVIPFVETVGKGAMAVPEQNGPTGAKAGVMLLSMVMVRVVATAHCPASGVNVYIVVTVLSIAGAQVPVIPFVEVVGNGAMAAPEQNGPTGANAGVILLSMVMVSVVVTAHCPASGVNVYVVVTVLSIAGAQVPVIPFVEVVGNGAMAVPEQNGPTVAKAGVMLLSMVMVIVVVTAHCPASGVNVYVVVTVLSIAGAQVPVIPFVEVVGKGAMAVPEQNGPTEANVGVMLLSMVMVRVVVTAHCPASGVNVYVVVTVLSIAGAQVPVIPLSEVIGNGAMAAPEQNGPTGENVGKMLLSMVMVRVVVTAHCPASGVNVYIVVTVLSMAGAQEPVMPFVEIVGNGAMAAPEQNGPTEAKAGVMLLSMVMVRVVVTAHSPASGVNVYVVVTVLSIAGAQVPVIPLSEVIGNGAMAAPEQNGPTGAKAGVILLSMVMVSVVVTAHCPASGVNE